MNAILESLGWTRDYSAVLPQRAGKRSVYEFAEKANLEYGFEPANDMEPVIERLGGRIHYLDLESWADSKASLFVHSRGDFDILLPRCTGILRDRFTLARMLGHYLLHACGKEHVAVFRYQTDQVKWEADWFASGFLMPLGEFEAKAQEWKNDPNWHWKLSTYFRVSVEVEKYRMDYMLEQKGK